MHFILKISFEILNKGRATFLDQWGYSIWQFDFFLKIVLNEITVKMCNNYL